MKGYFLEPLAGQDVQGAHDWYENEREELGLEFIEEFERAMDRACLMPQTCRIIGWDVRRVILDRFPYVVYFRQGLGGLIVLGVFHQKRDPAAWQGRVR